MTSIVSNDFRLHAARRFSEAVTAGGYYIWVGNHVDPSASRPLSTDTFDTSFLPYSRMILGKRVVEGDSALLVRDVPWTPNVVYAMYDDLDEGNLERDFFVTVADGSYVHAFKCLGNARGVPSVVAPDFGDVTPSDEAYFTSDGYQWKYMFSTPTSMVSRFPVEGMIPVLPNTSVSASAVPGAIEVIQVDDGGEGYSNHLRGTFSSSDLRVGGNNLIYRVGSNSTASVYDNFYRGCVMLISSGAAQGQFRSVISYQSDSSGQYVVLESPFSVPPLNGAEWSLDPEVVITGSGVVTLPARARALVNAAASNSVYRVEMLERGRGYSSATSEVAADPVIGLDSPAAVRMIYSPPGGHGRDAASELGSRSVAVSVKLSNTEANTIPAGGRFGQYGLMGPPVFQHADVKVDGTAFSFAPGQQAYRFSEDYLVTESASVSPASAVVTAVGTKLSRRLGVGDWVYVTCNEGTFLDKIEAASPDSITLGAPLGFSCTTCTLSRVTVGSCMTVTSTPSQNSLTVSNVGGPVLVGDTVAAPRGGGSGKVTSVVRSGKSKGFETFVQAMQLTGTYVSGSFSQNEQVYQGQSPSTSTFLGYVHTSETRGTETRVLVTGHEGKWSPVDQLKSVSGAAAFTPVSSWPAEVVPQSGVLLYIENINPINRGSSQSQTLCIVAKF